MPTDPFVAPRHVAGPDECDFYHTVDLPEFGLQPGSWDLRPGVDLYLSPIDFRRQRVLEIGSSDAFLTVELERRGAEVVALDLPEDEVYDHVPVEREDVRRDCENMRLRMRRRRNAFWLVHRLLGSRARLVDGHATRLPEGIGPVDYCFIGNVLQHLENPLRALASAARVARKGVIVTEANWKKGLLDPDAPVMHLLTPEKVAEGGRNWCFYWWQLTPGLVGTWLSILGMELVEHYEHHQVYHPTGRAIPHFTVVARRR